MQYIIVGILKLIKRNKTTKPTHTTNTHNKQKRKTINTKTTQQQTDKQQNKEQTRTYLEGVTVLQYDRLPHIRTRRELPWCEQTPPGMMRHKTYWDCAAEFVDGQDLPKQVSLAKLQYTDRGGDRFVVTAVDDSVTEKHVHLSVGCGAGADDGGSDN